MPGDNVTIDVELIHPIAVEQGATFSIREGEAVAAHCSSDLTAVLAAAKGSNLKVAAQNTYFENAGAFTGETSPQSFEKKSVLTSLLSVTQSVVTTSTKLMKTSTKKQKQSLRTVCFNHPVVVSLLKLLSW